MSTNRRKQQKARTSFLMQSQIENAMRVTRSNRQAAEYLRVSHVTYKKFAKLYKNSDGISLYDAHANRCGKGIIKTKLSKNRHALENILLGRHPTYPTDKLMRRMVVSGYASEQCGHCGFSEKRESDQKTPLILNHINGNKTDHRIENLEILCYNCFFLKVGDIRRKDLRNWAYDRPEEVMPSSQLLAENDDEALIESIKDMTISDEDRESLLELLKNLD